MREGRRGRGGWGREVRLDDGQGRMREGRQRRIGKGGSCTMGQGGQGIPAASYMFCQYMLLPWLRGCHCQRSRCCIAALLLPTHAGNVARILGAGAASTIGVNGLAEQLAKGR